MRTSGGDRVLTDVDDAPSVVVATPGAEPVPAGGYAAVVLLDTWLTLARPDLRTAEEALRRWLGAAALARPADEGGRVVAVGDPAHPALQALVRWDPAGFAAPRARGAAVGAPAARVPARHADRRPRPTWTPRWRACGCPPAPRCSAPWRCRPRVAR